ncbi:progesterone receptor isoform X2 [Ascaphus truei]
MEGQKKRSGVTQPPHYPGAETTRPPRRPSTDQVDLFQEDSDPDAISLDSFLYQRPEDEDPNQKREGLSSPDNSDLENVLDSILDTSPPGQLHPWSHFVAAEIPDITTTSTLSSSGKVKTLSASPTTALGQVTVWTGTTVAAAKAMKDSMSPKGKEKATLEEIKEEGNNFPGKKDSCQAVGTLRPILPPDLDFFQMPILPFNPAYLAARARQILEVDQSDQRPSPPSTSHMPQHLVTYANPQPSIKQGSYLYPEIQPDAKIKKEGASKESPLCPDYGLAPQHTRSPEPGHSLDFLQYKNSAPVYDFFKSAQGKKTESPGLVLPSTSTAPQTMYQPLSLNGHQRLVHQTAVMKESYLPLLQVPYAQWIRPDGDLDHSPQYMFETLPQKICLICADEASGCHYGVLTCGSCKVFFKRAIEGQHNYLCAGRNDCIVDKIRRKNCPSCRLRKCCQAGMVLGGRKFKKFSSIKTGRESDTIVFQQTTTASVESQQALMKRITSSSTQELQYTPELLQILQSIEPEVVYAGYDNTLPETPSALLSCLNQLCERQLLCVVKWSKSLPGFRTLHIDDQITLLQYSWMSLMVFAMGWRSYKHVSGQMLYFAPDLILNEQRMKESSFYSLCLSMWQLPQEFVKLQVTHEEFLCMKALLLLNTVPLEGLKSQSQFEEMRSNYIKELAKAIGLRHTGVVANSQRFYYLTKLMDSMHDLVKQLHLYCLNTFLQSRALSVEFPEMMSEVISAQLPKILAGMVKPLVFHKK